MSKYTEMAERLEKFWPNTLEIAEAAALLREADNVIRAYVDDKAELEICFAELKPRIAELEAALHRTTPQLSAGDSDYATGWNDCCRWLAQTRAALKEGEK